MLFGKIEVTLLNNLMTSKTAMLYDLTVPKIVE